MDYLYGTLCEHVGQNDYVLPIASKDKLGGVKIDGTTITIDADGTIHSAGGTALTAGDGIRIENNTIEVKDTINKDLTFNGENIKFLEGLLIGDYSSIETGDISERSIGLKIASEKEIHISSEDGVFINGGEVVGKNYVDAAIDGKQDKLTAGDNITISDDGVISSTGGGKSYTAIDGIYIDNTNHIGILYDTNTLSIDGEDRLTVASDTFAPVEKPNFVGDIEVYASLVSTENDDEEGTGVRASAHTKIQPNELLLTSGSASAHLKAVRESNVNKLLLSGSNNADIVVSGVANPSNDNEAVNLGRLNSELSDIESQLEDLSEEIENKQISLTPEQTAALNSGITQEKLSAINTSIENLESSVDSAVESVSSILSDIDDEIDSLSSDIEEIKGELYNEDGDSNLTSLQESINAIKEQVGDSPDGRTSSIEDTISILQSDLNTLTNTTVYSIQESIENISDSIDNIEESVSDLSDSVSEVEDRVSSNESSITTLTNTTIPSLQNLIENSGIGYIDITANFEESSATSVDEFVFTLDENNHSIFSSGKYFIKDAEQNTINYITIASDSDSGMSYLDFISLCVSDGFKYHTEYVLRNGSWQQVKYESLSEERLIDYSHIVGTNTLYTIISGVSEPYSDNDAANKAYVDNKTETIDSVNLGEEKAPTSGAVFNAIDDALGDVVDVLTLLNGYIPEIEPEET